MARDGPLPQLRNEATDAHAAPGAEPDEKWTAVTERGGGGKVITCTHVYIGTMPCGCHVAVVADCADDKRQTANYVQQFIRDGYSVSRHSLEELRNGTIKLARCSCSPVVEVGR